jgi:hypothetical protein
MKTHTLLALLTLFTIASCTKERTCQCKNATSTYDAGTVDKTKSQAKKYCKTISAGDTVCDLK